MLQPEDRYDAIVSLIVLFALGWVLFEFVIKPW